MDQTSLRILGAFGGCSPDPRGTELLEERSALRQASRTLVVNVPSCVSGVGNVLFEVPTDIVDSIVLYIEGETASFDTEGAFLALT